MGITEIIYGFGGLCLKIRDDFMDFKPCFKGYDLFSVYRLSINLDQMTDHHLIFHVVVMSVY